MLHRVHALVRVNPEKKVSLRARQTRQDSEPESRHATCGASTDVLAMQRWVQMPTLSATFRGVDTPAMQHRAAPLDADALWGGRFMTQESGLFALYDQESRHIVMHKCFQFFFSYSCFSEIE